MLQELKRDKPLHFRRAPGVAAPAPTRKEIANIGELIACDWLVKRGYILLERNWRSGRFGELDLIMRNPDHGLSFIEVKTRRMATRPGFVDFGFDAISWRKRRKILICARSFMTRTKSNLGFSCDAVLVTFERSEAFGGEVLIFNPEVLHIQSAFDEP